MTTTNNITVIGIGRLGICLALCLEKAGYHVLGVDLSPEYIEQIKTKTVDSKEPKVTAYLKNSQHFQATTSLQEGLEFSDLCFIVVPTNTIQEIQTYDHSALSLLLQEINDCAVSNKHLVICSTVFPGYIENTASQILTNCKETTLNYNPEFIAQGNIIEGLEHPDMVLIGEATKEAGERIEQVYKRLCAKKLPAISRMSIPSAEITKLAVNCFITGKIAFANLISDIADLTKGADKNEILAAIGKDQRIGSKNLAPGYGFGGPCFPRDNRALGNYASLLGIEPLLFKATDEANHLHAEFMAKKILEKDLKEYVFDDVCYKPNCPVPIIEHSQKLLIAQKLASQGKEVTILDNEEVIQKVKQQYGNIFKYVTQKQSASG